MEQIGDIIQEGNYRNDHSTVRKFKADCPPEFYKGLFLKAAQERLYFKDRAFTVDGVNKEVINQLYYYLVGSSKFTGDLLKGLLIIGNIGNGKTLIMESFIEVFNETSGKIMTSIHSKDIARILTEQVIGYLNKRPLFIDDIAKEEGEIKNYGTVVHPFEDLISERYKSGGLTFGSSNYKMIDLPYAKHTKDRMIQMFNIIVLPGNTRRT